MNVKVSYTIYDRLFFIAEGLVLPLAYMGTVGSEGKRWQIFGPRELVGVEAADAKAMLRKGSGIIEDFMEKAADGNEHYLWKGKALGCEGMRHFMQQGLQRSLTVEEFVLQTGHPCIGLYTAATGAVYPKDSSELYALLTSVDQESLETVPWAKDKYKVWPASVYSPCRLYCRRQGSKYYLGEYMDKEVTGWKISTDIRKAIVFTDPTAAFEKMDQLGLHYLRPELQLERAEERPPQIAYVICDGNKNSLMSRDRGKIRLSKSLDTARIFTRYDAAADYLRRHLFCQVVDHDNSIIRFTVCPVYLDEYGKVSKILD